MKNNLTILTLLFIIFLFATSCKKEPIECIAPLTTTSIAPSDTTVYYIVTIDENEGSYQTWANGVVMPFDFDTLYSGDNIRIEARPGNVAVNLVVRINGQIDIDSTCFCNINYTKTFN